MEDLARIGAAVHAAQDTAVPFGTVPFAAVSAADDAAYRQLSAATPRGKDVVGWWRDALEPTRLLPGATVAAAAALGQRFGRKSVLHWTPDDSGPHWLHVIEHPHTSPAEAAQAAFAHGIQGGSADGRYVYAIATAPDVARMRGRKHAFRGHARFVDASEYAALLGGV